MEGVDFAFSSPSARGLADAGKRFAMRYVGPGTSPKHLTVTEAAGLKAAGLSLVTLVEGAVGDPKGGFSVGVNHARLAVAMCKARGFPTDRPMYFAVDYDVSSSSWAAAREYLRGAGSVIGPALVGIYGEHDAMAWAARDGVAAWFFQTYAWSGGRWFAGNHVEQYRNGVRLAGGTVDLCRSKRADFGQWGQGGIAPPPMGGSEDMIFVIDGGPRNGHAGRAGGGTYEFASDGAELERWRADQGGVRDVHVTETEIAAGRIGVDVNTLRGATPPATPGEPGEFVPHKHKTPAGETGPAEAV